MNSNLNLWTWALVFTVLTPTCFAADKKQLAAAVAAVDENLKTPAGKKYDEAMGNEFPSKYMANAKQCKQSALAAGSGVDSFDILMKLDGKGKVQDVLVYPESSIALCTRLALLAGSFSAPPHGDYWINIHMQMKR